MRNMQESAPGEGFAAAETEDFVRRLVTTIKPRFTVENRSDVGLTLTLLQGLNENGFGKLIICGGSAEKHVTLKKEIAGLGLSPSIAVELRDRSALKSKFDSPIDLLVCSDDHEQVVRQLLPEINPFGILVLHSREGEQQLMREFLLSIEKQATMSIVRLPESLRLAMAQKRSGRK